MKQTVKTSRAAGQLEKMFRELNKHYFGGALPEPIISLKKTPSAYGHGFRSSALILAYAMSFSSRPKRCFLILKMVYQQFVQD